MKIDTNKLRKIIKAISDDLEKQESYISSLDQAIGDGDHGYNMNRGFNAILEIESKFLSIKEYFSLIGRTLMAKVGGASGPLYGMSFLMAANVIKNEEFMDWSLFKKFIAAFAQNLKLLGKAEIGEKTMLDLWLPFSEIISKIDVFNEDIKKELFEFIDIQVEKSKNLMATKGRASYLKERSIGTIDPGTFTSSIIIKEFLK